MPNFFENQHLARRNTKVLVLLYVLAVVGVIIAVDLVLAATYMYGYAEMYVPQGKSVSFLTLAKLVPAKVYLLGALGTALVIFLVSGWNIVQLSSGGKAVAQMVSARRVTSDTTDPLERRLVNVVEEMAIASGVRVPGIYIMDGEAGINAFAAGYDVSDSVVAVTRGTLETLTRDELQGVVAHEFSHILNGDMRLNIRMIGVLAGIVFVGSVGEFLMRSQRHVRDSRGTVPIFLGGLALLIIGYIGLVFARLIKAAVSRQREFLADASSVQFTRNPDGIAGALDQIHLSANGALIANRHAEDMSHMFFGQSVKLRLAGLFETHPPIGERIRRVHPRFEPSAYRPRRDPGPAVGEVPAEAAGFAGSDATAVPPAGRRRVDVGMAWKRDASQSAALVGSMQGSKIDTAARLIAALPAGLHETLHEVEGARAAIVSLLLAPKAEVMQAQIAALKAAGLESLAAGAAAAALLTRGLGVGFRLPVVDLALPAIKAAPEAARQELVAGLEAVINADRRVSLHEFVVLTLVRHQLEANHKPPRADRNVGDMQTEASLVLSLAAHAGTRADATGARNEALRQAMAAGVKTMGLPEQAAAAQLALAAAASALEGLRRLRPLEKARFVKGLFATVTADGTIRVGEAELMRLIGAVLDCPLPPMLDEIDPAALAA
jgi:Zn-dependent protease with chaperone function